jgi:hypothetical protein
MTVVSNTDTESRPIKWLVDEFKKGNLFIDDSFQRNYVWINKDRISLIETVILGYPIPEIYLWESDTDPATGETRFSIIDGQQRIKTIGLFMEGNLKLTAGGLEFSDAEYKGKCFSELGDELKSLVWSYKVSIRFVKKSVTRDDIIKMFLRLNRTSNALNPQELRNAEFHGEFLNASHDIAKLPFWEKWSTFAEMEIRRMQDVQFASTLLIFSRSGFEDETTQSSINKVYDLLNDDYKDRDKDVADVTSTLSYLDETIGYAPDLAFVLSKKTHAYTIFTLASYLKSKKYKPADLANKLVKWYEWHEGVQPPEKAFAELVVEYGRLSQEGVQKKANRFRRYEILLSYVEA